jgi:hypothetical protein
VTSTVQSLLFCRANGWTITFAKAWAKRRGYRTRDVDDKGMWIHLRQFPPGRFKRIRTVHFGDGIEARIGFTKGPRS